MIIFLFYINASSYFDKILVRYFSVKIMQTEYECIKISSLLTVNNKWRQYYRFILEHILCIVIHGNLYILSTLIMITVKSFCIGWTFTFMYFVGSAIHKIKIPTKYSFILSNIACSWNIHEFLCPQAYSSYSNHKILCP